MSCVEDISHEQQTKVDALEGGYIDFYNSETEKGLLFVVNETYSKGERKDDLEVLETAQWLNDLPDTAFCSNDIQNRIKEIVHKSFYKKLLNQCDNTLLVALSKEKGMEALMKKVGDCNMHFVNGVFLFQSDSDPKNLKIGLAYIRFKDNGFDTYKRYVKKVKENEINWNLVAKSKLR